MAHSLVFSLHFKTSAKSDLFYSIMQKILQLLVPAQTPVSNTQIRVGKQLRIPLEAVLPWHVNMQCISFCVNMYFTISKMLRCSKLYTEQHSAMVKSGDSSVRPPDFASKLNLLIQLLKSCNNPTITLLHEGSVTQEK